VPNAGNATANVPPPNELELLRAFVVAHAQPDPRSGTREPIMYLPFRGRMQHHGLPAEPPEVDDAVIQEMQGHGLISIDYRENSWLITPTPHGRALVAAHDRSLHDEPLADRDAIVDAVELQLGASNPLAWPAVRPVLDALRSYWQQGGYPEHGIPLKPVAAALPDEVTPVFAATMRALVDGDYLEDSFVLLRGQAHLVDGRVISFPLEVTLTEKTRAILDGWPGAAPSELVENLLAVLASAAADEQDPARKGRLEALASALKDVGVSLASEVIAKVVTGGVL
jgi:hypothetical protein